MAKLNVKHFKYIDAGKAAMKFLLPEKIMDSLAFRLFRSWVFQGVLYMEYSEIIFRIFLEIILVALFLYILPSYGQYVEIVLAVVLAHTYMWTFNGHFWALSIGDNRRMAKNTPERILSYFNNLDKRVHNSRAIDGCVMFGSLTRGEFTENSDLDVLLCKKDGYINLFRAYIFGFRERFIAFVTMVPIELYFYNIDVFDRLDDKEAPLLFKDASGDIRKVIKNYIDFKNYPFNKQVFFSSL